MALPKQIKIGGAYYQGYKLAVSSATGAYSSVIVQTKAMALNSFSVTPGTYGAGDTFSLTHYNDASGTGVILAILATSIYNVGKSATIMLDFPAAEQINAGQSLKFTYTNSATLAMDVYMIAEVVGITKTE